MGENTKVPYVHHSFSPWWGCGHNCLYCFAATFAHRLGYSEGGTKGHALFGPGSRRRFFGERHWSEPLKWNRRAEKRGVRERVLCPTMCDPFEDASSVHEQDGRKLILARGFLLTLIERTPWLDWLVLTKRPGNMATLISQAGRDAVPPNFFPGTTIENQPAADKRVEQLLQVPARRHFVSYEPALGEVNLAFWLPSIDWVVAGCMSGPQAEHTDPDWLRDVRDQCVAAGTPYFLKQMVVDGKLTKMPELDGRQWAEVPR